MIVLVVTGVSILGALLFTSPYLLLAKGSLITGGIGTLFLLSLLMPQPLIYYLASNTGQDPEARAEFAALWEKEPAFRRLMRRLTLIWGLGMYVEASLRLLLIPRLPVAVFLPVSEAMWIAFFALMISVELALRFQAHAGRGLIPAHVRANSSAAVHSVMPTEVGIHDLLMPAGKPMDGGLPHAMR